MFFSVLTGRPLSGSVSSSFATGSCLAHRAPLQARPAPAFFVHAAHKKGGGSTKNGRDSNAQRRGVKVYGGQPIKAGGIIIRQLGTQVAAHLDAMLMLLLSRQSLASQTTCYFAVCVLRPRCIGAVPASSPGAC